MMVLFFSRCLQAVSIRIMPLGGEDRRSVPVSLDPDCLLLAADLGWLSVSQAETVVCKL